MLTPAPIQQTSAERALHICAVENALYDLFGKGKLHGTIHTCIGQEFSGAVLGDRIWPSPPPASRSSSLRAGFGAAIQGNMDPCLGA